MQDWQEALLVYSTDGGKLSPKPKKPRALYRQMVLCEFIVKQKAVKAKAFR